MLQRVREFLWVLSVPLSWLWGFVAHQRGNRAPTFFSKIPVISIGNLHSGGSGKTPVVAEVVQRFSTMSPAILSRGYLARLTREGARVSDAKDGTQIYGDEPWMLYQMTGTPVYIGADRKKNIERFGLESRHGLLVLDDGFQHRRINRDFDVVVIASEIDPLTSFCLPAGDLREPLSGLRRASSVLLTGVSESAFQAWENLIAQLFPDLPVFRAERKPEGFWTGDERVEIGPGEKLGIFCGIANPKRFLETKELSNAAVLGVFPDHHQYTESDLAKLVERAHASEVSRFVTTAKDYFKVVDQFNGLGVKINYLRIGYQIPDKFWNLAAQKLGAAC